MLPEHTIASPFPNSKYLFRIEFDYLGEYSKRMFMDKRGPSPVVNFVDGTEFTLVRLPSCLCVNHMLHNRLCTFSIECLSHTIDRAVRGAQRPRKRGQATPSSGSACLRY
jgi:hypothetical protein